MRRSKIYKGFPFVFRISTINFKVVRVVKQLEEDGGASFVFVFV